MTDRKNEAVRNLFSKAAVVSNAGGISAVYSDKRRWITQELKDRKSLCDLIRESTQVGIRIKKGDRISLFFQMPTGEQETQILMPLEKETSVEELEERIRDMPPSEEFLAFFAGTDLDDEKEVREKLRKWMEKKMEEMQTSVVELDVIKRWNVLSAKVSEFAQSLQVPVILSEPDGISEGYAELQLPEDRKSALWICGKKKEFFEELAEISSLITFELNVENGYVNIIFF